MITVQLLGGAALLADGTPIAGPPTQRHRVALLALIVAAWPKPLARDRAMALLWPERDLSNARRLLNLAVHVLRGTLGEVTIVSAGDGLLLNPLSLHCDLHDLRVAVASGIAGQCERIAQLYAGPLLDGFYLDESSEFSYWLDQERSELAHAYVGALRELAARQEQRGDHHGRVGTCRRLVIADPHSSAYALSLMHALESAGDRAGAIRHAAEHASRMRADLELDPDPDVVTLAERLRASPIRRPTSPNASSQRRADAVAVLPFLSSRTDAGNDFFADGVTEDVIAHLSKIRSLRVISRSSVAPFRDRLTSFKDIAQKLGATFLLDGSVRHAGDRVRIVVTLIHAESDETHWTETYDRQLTDIFAIQTDVALHIAAALKSELTRDEQARVRREPTADVQAYRYFLQGRQWFVKYTTESMHQAKEYFEKAIARDPSFALAYAQLAMVYTELEENGTSPADNAYRLADAAAANALRLDPELSAAYSTAGYLKMVLHFDWSGAERDFIRALELSPSNADAYDLYGRLCAAVARYDEAISLHRTALELDPLVHRLDLATTLLRAGHYDEALVRTTDVVELDPNYDRARATLGWAYILSGRRNEGIAELERAVTVSSSSTLWLGQLGAAYGLNGQGEKAREILRVLEARAVDRYVSPYHFAYVYAGLGEADQAMDWLERAATERIGPIYGIKGSFVLTSLHGNPRFQALLHRMKLE
ncbi:MAG: tetratricopeptide repeat protein [Gemmatimonadaceae bacterium]